MACSITVLLRGVPVCSPIGFLLLLVLLRLLDGKAEAEGRLSGGACRLGCGDACKTGGEKVRLPSPGLPGDVARTQPRCQEMRTKLLANPLSFLRIAGPRCLLLEGILRGRFGWAGFSRSGGWRCTAVRQALSRD